jgi:ubiquinone/menaquinone biosynthesis C-methylase UbiE
MSDSVNDNREDSILSPRSSIPWKARAREQWGANPCGAHVAKQSEFGTREYFDAIERFRYIEASPWMKQAIGFDEFSGKSVLEVGCGTGTDLLQFARGGALVTGLDLTPRSIEIVRRRFEVYGYEGQFAIGDAENLAFPGESFDLVYSFGVLHHTPDTERAISEVRRVLKPGGKAIVMLYHRTSLYYWGALMLKRGLLGGDLIRETPSQMMSRYVEYSETGGRPLVKAYTRNQARQLFRDFGRCEISVNQLTRGELGAAGARLPEGFFQWLARNFGWNLLIKATR